MGTEAVAEAGIAVSSEGCYGEGSLERGVSGGRGRERRCNRGGNSGAAIAGVAVGSGCEYYGELEVMEMAEKLTTVVVGRYSH